MLHDTTYLVSVDALSTGRLLKVVIHYANAESLDNKETMENVTGG
jgi:hypothetical protein